MTKDKIVDSCQKMFPEWSKNAINITKIGSRAIRLDYENQPSIIFMYTDDGDWTFGTKIWRHRPGMKKKGAKE